MRINSRNRGRCGKLRTTNSQLRIPNSQFPIPNYELFLTLDALPPITTCPFLVKQPLSFSVFIEDPSLVPQAPSLWKLPYPHP